MQAHSARAYSRRKIKFGAAGLKCTQTLLGGTSILFGNFNDQCLENLTNETEVSTANKHERQLVHESKTLKQLYACINSAGSDSCVHLRNEPIFFQKELSESIEFRAARAVFLGEEAFGSTWGSGIGANGGLRGGLRLPGGWCSSQVIGRGPNTVLLPPQCTPRRLLACLHGPVPSLPLVYGTICC